ncbi:MAG: endopeptidase La [Thermodesulfovibrio sp.]|jgi:ATP-dependent Lon protease|uniref:endopeptidase La n=2 Tax=Thermodesulfovibrio TaxID=28261 RepID=A0A2J6WP26_9BACT|nr:MAG: endopeptidase La [Thermodesulfovibrio aggregans]
MKIFKKTDHSEENKNTIVEELRRKIFQSEMPSQVRDIALAELDLLSKMNPTAAEYTISLTYIEYLTTLPWNKKTADNLDLERAERILNERHYGLYGVKNRILEHLAVKILSSNRNPRILIVDDEEIARKNLEHILKKENYEVVTAKNGAEAFKLLDEQEFEIVLTDIKMEGLDGFAILDKVKAKYPNTKVIMITAYAAVDNAVEAIKRGAFHYIAKPFKIEEVKLSIKQASEDRVSTISTKGSILCFAGPPGTGKTSLGKSIADALGRKFARISLGGIKDEAEIRGHRRTYAGAKPGRIIEEIRRTGVANPVLMLDEIDKICQDFKGDPASALLEALDPEQNYAFIDHYLDVPFDLSGVMFIVTANIPDNIQPALLDRMEVIEFSGYTEEEKKNIALKHLIPKQITEQGLTEFPPAFTEEAILKIIQEYTREAGIRNLERMIATICRKLATEIVKGSKPKTPVKITPEMVEKYLGPRRYYFEVADAKNRVGVVTGLVWTETGGDIIFVEAAKMKGKRELILTGSLGNIMRESAQAALSYIKSNASVFGISEEIFENQDIHIHVPQGAIPKDGPSAGATIAMALISLFTNRPARRDIAITGELTLSGRILPVGGIKEKILAAKRAGVKTVIVPHRNKVDIDNLPEDFKRGLKIIFMEKIEDVVNIVLI